MNIINILNTGFTLCLAFAILFFVIAVVLFFIFDIRTIFNIRSGRAQAKTVKEMQEANSNTGRLRVGKQTQTAKLSSDQQKSRQGGKAPERTAPVPAPAKQEAEPVFGGADETQVLSQNSSAAVTEMLSNKPDTTESVAVSKNTSSAEEEIYFEIVKKVICRDTDEVIR